MRAEHTTKPAGAQAQRLASIDALVDEASEESFPCSDAPAFTGMVRVGAPLSVATPTAERTRSTSTSRDRRLRRTGPKHERWLVQTVGLLVACVGAALLAASRGLLARRGTVQARSSRGWIDQSSIVQPCRLA